MDQKNYMIEKHSQAMLREAEGGGWLERGRWWDVSDSCIHEWEEIKTDNKELMLVD